MSRSLGVMGEEAACKYMINMGCDLCERNYRLGKLEVDIIARRDNDLYFVEVKTRSGVDFGAPLEAIPVWKRRHIIKVAKYYISKRGLFDLEIHFAVIGVDLDGEEPNIEFIDDAFGEDGV